MSMFGVRFVMPSGNVMAFADDKKSAEEFVDRLRLSPSLIREYAVKIVTLVGDEPVDGTTRGHSKCYYAGRIDDK